MLIGACIEVGCDGAVRTTTARRVGDQERARSPVKGSSTKKNLNTGDLVNTLAVTGRFDLTDAHWATLEPLLPMPSQ